ncbi:MAG: glycosyltransferase family 4 protein [Pseudomonadota bacterium]
MRILYLVADPGIPACGPSGASAHVRGITAGLAALGHDVRLITAAGVDGRGALEAPSVPWAAAGVSTWPRAPRPIAWYREVRTARGVARRALAEPGGADLVIARHSLYSDAGARVARRLGVPLVLEVNAPLVLERRRFGVAPLMGPAERWERRALQVADHLVAVSSWLVDWLVREQGCDPARVHLLPNGVPGLPGDRARGRALAGLPHDAWVLGFLGAFRPWHGLGMLRPLLEALPEAHLLLVGAARPGEEHLVADLARQPRVTMAGRRPEAEVADLVAAMDLGLAPYPADAPPWFCPLKILAYRAQGTPALAADVGDCRALVGEAGAALPPGDIQAFTAAARAWRGRRVEPAARTWRDVAAELLVGVVSEADPRQVHRR